MALTRRGFCLSSNMIGGRSEAEKGAPNSRKRSSMRSRPRSANTPTSGITSSRFGPKHETAPFPLFSPLRHFHFGGGRHKRVSQRLANRAIRAQNLDGGFYANARPENIEETASCPGTFGVRGSKQLSLATRRPRANHCDSKFE